jgi:hypothetical protein
VALDRRGNWWIGSVDRLRREERERSMWALAGVVGRVDVEHVFELAAAEDQQPVETLGSDGADEAFGVGVCLWRGSVFG